MLYDYKCQECGYFMEDVYQSIKAEALKKCPSCNKDSLSRVVYGGLGSFVKDVRTVGQIADRNWKTMGSYKRSEIENKNKDLSESNKKNKLIREINKMTTEQKKNFIIKGEK
jgi:putative FmdB family regulatory protein